MEHDVRTQQRIEQPSPQAAGSPITNARLGMLLFVLGEVMVFVALMAGYAMVRFGTKGFAAMPMLPAGAAVAPLVALVVCSNGFRFVLHALSRENIRRYRWSMMVTSASAALFLVLVGFMWSDAGTAGIVPGASIRSGMFYLLTGAHALHALGGLVPLAAMTLRGLPRRGRRPSWASLHALQLYWDFVTLVGIVIYIVLFVVR